MGFSGGDGVADGVGLDVGNRVRVGVGDGVGVGVGVSAGIGVVVGVSGGVEVDFGTALASSVGIELVAWAVSKTGVMVIIGMCMRVGTGVAAGSGPAQDTSTHVPNKAMIGKRNNLPT